MTDLQKLLDLLKALVVGGFYGNVSLRFEAGRIVCIKKEETIKL